jgi:hypothetical protein
MSTALAARPRTTPLADYLSEAGAIGFKWGSHDCCTFIANWAKRITGQDPAGPWRDAYVSQVMAEIIVRQAGGLGPLLHGALKPQGWVAVTGCAPGDISIVQAPTPQGKQLTSSIFVGRGRFALLTQRGLVVAPMPFMLGWRHPDCPNCHAGSHA